MRTSRVRSQSVSAVDAVGSPFRDERSEQSRPVRHLKPRITAGLFLGQA